MLILPDNGMFEVPELNAMVQEVNETQVERQEQLSDKVQFCDGKTAVMENAERRKHVWRKKKQQKKQLGEQKQKVESMENWRKPRRRSKQKGQIQSQRIGRKTLPQYYNEK